MNGLKTVKDVVVEEGARINDFFTAITVCNKAAQETEIFDAKIIGSSQQICLVGHIVVNANGQSRLQRFSVGEGMVVIRYIK